MIFIPKFCIHRVWLTGAFVFIYLIVGTELFRTLVTHPRSPIKCARKQHIRGWECLRWYSYSNCNDYLTSQSSIEPSVELYKYLNVIVHSIFHRYTWEEEGYFCKWVIKKHKLAFLTSLICMCNMNFDFLKNNIAMELNGSSDHVKLWIKVRPWEFFAASSRPDMDLLKKFLI